MRKNADSTQRYEPPTLEDLERMFGVTTHLCTSCKHVVTLPHRKYGRPTIREACVASHDVDGTSDAKWCDEPVSDCRLYDRADY